jgi:hypothetical protein
MGVSPPFLESSSLLMLLAYSLGGYMHIRMGPSFAVISLAGAPPQGDRLRSDDRNPQVFTHTHTCVNLCRRGRMRLMAMLRGGERRTAAMAVPVPLAGQGWAHARRALASASAGMPFAFLQSSSVTFRPATLDGRGQEIVATARSRHPTLFDLIQAVSEVAASEQETLATVADLINSGQVQLCGDAAGAIGEKCQCWHMSPRRNFDKFGRSNKEARDGERKKNGTDVHARCMARSFLVQVHAKCC